MEKHVLVEPVEEWLIYHKQVASNPNMYRQSRQEFVGFLEFFILYVPNILGNFTWMLQKEALISKNNLDTCLWVILACFYNDKGE